MKKMLLSVGLAVVGMAFTAEVQTWPAPVVRTANRLRVSVNGKSVEMVTIPAPDHCLTGAEAQPYQAAFFDADEDVEVEVAGTPMKDVRVLPLSAGVKPQVMGDRVKFRAKPPFTLAVEPTGRHHALILVANAIEKDAPKPGDPGVVYIGPGSHHRDEALVLKSDETLYLAPGAYLESALVAKGTNITVRGHGILSGSCWAHARGPKGGGVMASFSGKNITVRDVTLMSSFNWTLVLNHCEDVLVDNVRILNGRVLNDDGIDVCASRRVTIRNCFIRAQDDCITPKWWCEDLLVEHCALWADVANIFRIGYECSGPKEFYRNFVVRDIDILHQSIRKQPASAYWAENAIFIQPGNDQRFENFLFERLRFDTPEAGDRLLTMRTFKVNDQWQHHKVAGHFNGLVLRDVHVPAPLAPDTLGVWLESHDPEHRVDNVRFENARGIGPLTTVGDVRNVAIPPSAFAPAVASVTNWTSQAKDGWRVLTNGVALTGASVVLATESVPITNGVFTALVRAETPPKGVVPTTFGLRVAGPQGSWSLGLHRAPPRGQRAGRHDYDFTHHCGKQSWAPKGTVCLYSRKGEAWEYGRSYRFSINLSDRQIEATIFDEDGVEMFAEAWQFGSTPAVKAGRPQVFTWNGLGGTFTEVGVLPAGGASAVGGNVPGIFPVTDTQGSLGAMGTPKGAGDFEIERPRAHGGPVLRAVDFGFSPTNHLNGAAIQRALDAAVARGASRLELAPGVYNCFDAAGIKACGLHDFTFDGKGAVLVFRRDKGGDANLTVSDTERCEFRNFKMDWDWEHDPLASLGTCVGKFVDEKNDNASYFDMKLDRPYPGYPATPSLQTATTIDSERRHLIGTSPNRLVFLGNAKGPKSAWIAPDTLRIWPAVKPTPDAFVTPHYLCYYNPNANRSLVRNIPVGISYRLLHYYYGMGGITMQGNRHFTLADVDIWSCRGGGLGVGGAQHHWQVVNVKLAPPPEKLSERLTSSTADGHHVSRSLGWCKYIGFTISFCNDDSHNFHDCTAYGVPEGTNALRVTFAHGVRYLSAQVGNEIELRESNFDAVGWKGRIVKIDGNTMTMDHAVPQPKGDRFLFFNRSVASDHILMRDCVCRDSHFRNLFQSNDLTLESCIFDRTGGTPVQFTAAWLDNLWCEGMGVTNVVVRNCVFRNNNQQTRGRDGGWAAEIRSCLERPRELKLPPTQPGFFSDILVENCRFENSSGRLADLTSVRNFTFRGNTIIDDGVLQPPTRASGFLLKNCAGVTVENNRFHRAEGHPVPMVSCTEGTHDVLCRGNEMEGK